MIQNSNLLENRKRTIVEFLNNEILELKWVSLFGSVINKNFDENRSDIDIAFISSRNITNVERWEIQEKLASQLNIDIDLVDLSKSNDVISFEAISKGINIFKKSSKKLEQFLDSIYINYIQLNEDRKEILEMYK